MNPLTNIIKAAAYLQGWLAGQNLPKPIVEVINTLIEAVEKPINQYRQPITLEDDEIERIAGLIADRLESKQHVETKIDVEPEPEPESHDKPKEPNPEIDDSIKKKIEKGQRTGLYPEFKGKTMCGKCLHLAPSEGKGYNMRCTRYNTHTIQKYVDRICPGYRYNPDFPNPKITCGSCSHFMKELKVCNELRIVVPFKTVSMWGICPCWKSKTKEPVPISYMHIEAMLEVEECDHVWELKNIAENIRHEEINR